MPAFSLDPNAVGTYAAWTNSGGVDALESVSDATDAHFIYVPAGAGPIRHSFGLANLPAEARVVVPPVVLYSRWDGAIGGMEDCWSFFRSGGVDSDSVVAHTKDAAWHDFNNNFAVSPSGGWTPAILNATEIGVMGTSTATALTMTKLQATGNYTTGGGGFAFLVVSLVGAMLGANLALADMPGIAREVARTHRPGEGISIIQVHEYEAALRELRAHPFRAWSL